MYTPESKIQLEIADAVAQRDAAALAQGRRLMPRRMTGVQSTPRTTGAQSTQVPGRSTVHGAGR